MAEGGGEEKDDNPFSFKKFVNQQTTEDEDRSMESVDVEQRLNPDLPDVSATNRRDRREERDSNHNTSNPFSFKKFLQTSSRNPSNGHSSLKTLDLAYDLPDFVQDHYSGNDSPRCRHRVPPTGEVPPLPDFALDSTASSYQRLESPSVDPDSSQELNQSHFPYRDRSDVMPPDVNNTGPSLDFEHGGARPRTNAYEGQSSPVPRLNLDELQSSDGSNSDEQLHPRICQTNSAGGLPDFLPDSVVSGAGARPKTAAAVLENGLHSPDGSLRHDSESLIAQVQMLSEENLELRNQLAESRLQVEQQETRVSNVLREKDDFRKKEAEETAALEAVVEHVEANLKKATQRATSAENTVTKLRQDLKQLQTQVQRLQAENEVLRGFPSGIGSVEDTSHQVAQQLTLAATTAEQHLKQLFSGVDQLKMLAEILSSGDKVTDMGSEGPSTQQRAKASTPQGAEGGAPL